MKPAISNLNAWLAIAAVVLSSCAGDVLLARAMKQIGDVGEHVVRLGTGGSVVDDEDRAHGQKYTAKRGVR